MVQIFMTGTWISPIVVYKCKDAKQQYSVYPEKYHESWCALCEIDLRIAEKFFKSLHDFYEGNLDNLSIQYFICNCIFASKDVKAT